MVDWCNLPHSTDIWSGILKEVIPEIDDRVRHYFFDIADPSRRSDQDLNQALDVVSGYNKFGKVTLGLNENETEKLYSSLNRVNQTDEKKDITLIEKGTYIFKNIQVWNLLIHPINWSISINSNGISEIPGRVVSEPKISTGGGDNFNAGYCFGQLTGMDIEESMVIGMANSGAYVQNGQSSSLEVLKEYIDTWINEIK